MAGRPIRPRMPRWGYSVSPRRAPLVPSRHPLRARRSGRWSQWAGNLLPARIWILRTLAFRRLGAVAIPLAPRSQWWPRGPGHRGGAGPGAEALMLAASHSSQPARFGASRRPPPGSGAGDSIHAAWRQLARLKPQARLRHGACWGCRRASCLQSAIPAARLRGIAASGTRPPGGHRPRPLFWQPEVLQGRPGGSPGARAAPLYLTVSLVRLPFCRAPAHRNPAASLGPLQRAGGRTPPPPPGGARMWWRLSPLLRPRGNSAFWRSESGSQPLLFAHGRPLSTVSRWPVVFAQASVLTGRQVIRGGGCAARFQN